RRRGPRAFRRPRAGPSRSARGRSPTPRRTRGPPRRAPRASPPSRLPLRTRRSRAAHGGHLLPQPGPLVDVLPALDRLDLGQTDALGELPAELRRQDAERVRPELLDGGAEARLVAQPLVPQLRVHAVVRLLAVDL